MSAPLPEKNVNPEPKTEPASLREGDAGHRRRLRERFLEGGLQGFHDYEIVELLLTLSTPRRDCKPAAKAAVRHFKNLQGVLEASAEELCAIDGIGEHNQLGIQLVRAVAERYLERKILNQQVLNHSRDLYRYLRHSLRDKKRECFKAIFLDAKNRVIASETLFEGTLTASSVYPREVMRAALRNHAAALIFAHNHPSGDPRPSPEDVQVTRQLVLAAATMDITVHEHLIVGAAAYFSFADEGHIARMTEDCRRLLRGE